MNRIELLEKAGGLINHDRKKEYGNALDNFSNIAVRMSLTLKNKLTSMISPREVALLMVDVKTARLSHLYKDDSAIDGAGYFALSSELPDKLPVHYEQFFFDFDD